MTSTSPLGTRIIRNVAPIAAALIVIGLGATPSLARPDPGNDIDRANHVGERVLERVGTQRIRCDNLTGNGVPAPSYIPEP